MTENTTTNTTASGAAYDLIDRYLRNNLDDADYAEYSAALEVVLAASAPPAPTEQWTLAKDQLPPCRDDQLYIGLNSAGFAGVFNAVADIAGDVHCMYETAEEVIDVLSGLQQWRVFTYPAPPQGAAKEQK